MLVVRINSVLIFVGWKWWMKSHAFLILRLTQLWLAASLYLIDDWLIACAVSSTMYYNKAQVCYSFSFLTNTEV